MELFVSRVYTEPFGFTSGIEGPACDGEGNIYAVNYSREHTIGRVTPLGECSIFLELPNGSIGNGIRFNQAGDMFIADYANHSILKVNMDTKEIAVHAHEPKMNQPNDICITPNGWLFASDPNWPEETGQIWRIDPNGNISLIESGMGTTNGIEVSPDGTKLYVNETVQRNIWCYDLDADQQISNKTLFHRFDDYGVDGMRCDVEGNLYVTRYGKGTVVKLSSKGDLLEEIKLHGKNCTNLTFGGKDGRTCYVTLADQGNLEVFNTDIAGRCWSMWQ
jgi:gluconolactonase